MKKMLLALPALLVAAGFVSVSAAALTPAQALERRTIGELEFSPDGTHLVFTVMEPVRGAARQRNIWILDVASGRIRQLTFSAKSDSSPRWAPDGQSIAFLSDRDGAAQLYRLPLRGGEADKLTDRKGEIGAFRWSPDGTRIARLMAEPKSDAQEKREKDKDDSRVVDKDSRLPRIWTVPYEKLDGFIKSSPMTYVKHAKTPTLLLQGEDDTTDPIGQSQQFHHGLKRYGVESELVLYPREPHGLREEKHLLDRLNRITAWFDKYLMPPAAATEPQR